MAFVNEVVSDADIDKYGLPFPKGGGLYWTRDSRRDIFLWGGLVGNPAHGDEIKGRFHLCIKGDTLDFVLRPGRGSLEFSDVPYVVNWDYIENVNPSDMCGLDRDFGLSVLREALTCYGRNGGSNRFTPVISVVFGF
jgi:hypothetical protein